MQSLNIQIIINQARCARAKFKVLKGLSPRAKFKELSPILTARGVSYHFKGKIFRAWCPACFDIWD